MLREVDSWGIFAIRSVDSTDSARIVIASTGVPEVGKVVEGYRYGAQVPVSLSSELFVEVDIVRYLSYMDSIRQEAAVVPNLVVSGGYPGEGSVVDAAVSLRGHSDDKFVEVDGWTGCG